MLLEVVAEKTGYPAEMLEPGMQLDADLGIDSIKRVEILSALQERLPDAPVIKPEHLGTLRTLDDIAGFLGGGARGRNPSPDPARGGPRGRRPGRAPGGGGGEDGLPAEMLEPGMQLDADLGIDSIKRVEILSALQERLPEAPVIKPEHLGTLRTLDDIVGFLGGGGTAPRRPRPVGDRAPDAEATGEADAPRGSAPGRPRRDDPRRPGDPAPAGGRGLGHGRRERAVGGGRRAARRAGIPGEAGRLGRGRRRPGPNRSTAWC